MASTTAVDFVPLEGRCTCGSIRYRLEAPPLFVHCCHCTWCQRETGSAFAVNALIEATCVTRLTAEPDPVPTPSASGRGQTIFRCPTCRVAVWSTYAGAGSGILFVRTGTLDQPERIQPDIHIYTSTRLPWVALPPDVPAMPEYYDSRQLWPEASRARFRAARNPAGKTSAPQ